MTLLETPAPSLSEQEAAAAAARLYGLVGNLKPLASERDQNFYLGDSEGARYVLKISNAAEDPRVIDFEVRTLEHVRGQGPGFQVPRVVPTRDGRSVGEIEHAGQLQRVRLLSFLDGSPLAAVPASSELRRRLGAALARLARALRGLFHPAAGRALLWDLKHAPALRRHLHRVECPARRRLADQVLRHFESRILPQLPALRAQIVHNDFNPDNVLITPREPFDVAGVVDFGDIVHASLAADLAVAVAYQLFAEPDPVGAAADVAGGYHAVTPLEEAELSVLLDLAATRLAMSGIISSWRSSEHPGNRDYILSHAAHTWPTLECLAGLDRGATLTRLREACGPPSGAGTGEAFAGAKIPLDELRRRRERSTAPSLGLFYDQPLHLVRGEGVWLYDADGRTYLDAYNNVAHIGHAHPRITTALTEQARLLNTNTRYLHRHIVDYAERLAATLPGALRVCMFVCSGSEANDLAWRLARSVSGGTGVVVTENAYHGNTTAVMQFSPEELPAQQTADWVATVPAPDLYRGKAERGEAVPGSAAVAADRALATLASRGHRPAAFFFDSIFTSDGIHLPPPAYLETLFERVHSAGGLCVADEVQAGFGRTGDTFWCFQRYGAVPDIVTLGKPMGNGHPIAAVITTPEIARAFANREHYFNTFGGNPVSCAVGLALLDALHEERLRERAAAVGEHLRKGLESLKASRALIADVRGSGLFFGVELTDAGDGRAPAGETAAGVVNEMRRRGILIGRTGNSGQVLKIRPPMVFSRSHADRLIETLDTVLHELDADSGR